MVSLSADACIWRVWRVSRAIKPWGEGGFPKAESWVAEPAPGDRAGPAIIDLSTWLAACRPAGRGLVLPRLACPAQGGAILTERARNVKPGGGGWS